MYIRNNESDGENSIKNGKPSERAIEKERQFL